MRYFLLVFVQKTGTLSKTVQSNFFRHVVSNRHGRMGTRIKIRMTGKDSE